jgi:N-methylhydantoinase A/oxoprolinase/acetone carboxylase beta subunit
VRLAPVVLSAVALSLSWAGCGTAADRADARTVTERFYGAIRADDGAAACEQLSEAAVKQLESQSGQDCADVVTRLEYEGGEIAAVEVFATNAKVDLTSAESGFLSLEPDGWRLTAIGCKPEEGKPRDRPLDCEVEA